MLVFWSALREAVRFTKFFDAANSSKPIVPMTKAPAGCALRQLRRDSVWRGIRYDKIHVVRKSCRCSSDPAPDLEVIVPVALVFSQKLLGLFPIQMQHPSHLPSREFS